MLILPKPSEGLEAGGMHVHGASWDEDVIERCLAISKIWGYATQTRFIDIFATM